MNPNEFQERRARLLSLMDYESIMVLYSGVAKVKSADECYPFEVNRNFYYLTGIDQEDSALVLINSEGEQKEFLFVSPFDERKEKWYGKRLTTAEAAMKSGIQNVLINTSLEAKIQQVINPDVFEYGSIRRMYIDLDDEIKIAQDTTTKDIKETIASAYPELEMVDAYPLMTTLRLRKSAAEIEALKEAIHNTKIGIYSIWKEMAEGKKEYEMADLFLHVENDLSGYQGLSFPTIMATGKNAACLHYPTPLDELKDGDLLLMDLGSRNEYYCADISRTVPVNGKFSDFQKTVYNIVLGANKMVAAMARPGVTIQELQDATIDYLANGCLAAGLIDKKEDILKYYFHGVSHLIGLDTHDPYLSVESREYKNIPLEPGMVISDEPGLYMAERSLGIRVEDDLLITRDGCEVLSASIVKEISDIEERLAAKIKNN